MSRNRNEILIPKYHWRPDRPDSRDYIYCKTNPITPDVVDLRSYCSPVENQGNLGSCTGQAIAGAIELLNRRNKITHDVSRLFIYYQERVMLGTVNYDSGAYIRDGIKACYKYGAPIEQLWPYMINKFRDRPTPKAYNDGIRRRVSLYERIVDHDGCIDALTNGYPVTIGFKVYDSFERSSLYKTGIMPYPDTTKERLLGGHAVLLVGYDKRNNLYIARNSWGAGWGDGGYFYMPFDVIKNKDMSSDFWVINQVSNS